MAEIYPELTSRKIIVSEWVEGQAVSKVQSEDVRSLCTALLNCYLIQVRLVCPRRWCLVHLTHKSSLYVPG